MCSSLNIFLHCLSLELEWKLTLFQSCGHYWVFQIFWHIGCSTFTASSFRIWNSSTGIPSLPLALFIVMLPKATWLHIPGCLALGEWSHLCDYLGREDLFCTVLLCILATSSNILYSRFPTQSSEDLQDQVFSFLLLTLFSWLQS